MRVLIAEDDPVNRRLLGRLLEQMEFEPVVVDRGDLALQKILEYGIQLAVLDWVMPGLTGPQVCQKLRGSGRLVYTIILTGRQSDQDMLEALEAGASDFLTKPMRRLDLLARLRVGRRITDLQTQFAQSSRIAAVGHLAAGMAHEINTPIQFLGDNLRFVEEGVGDLVSFAGRVREVAAESGSENALPEPMKSLLAEGGPDLDYLAEEIPRALAESLEGVNRIGEIIRSLYDFARPDADSGEDGEEDALEPIALRCAIEPVLNLIRSRIPRHMEIDVDIGDELPTVRLHRRRFNEAVMNILSNAVDVLLARDPGSSAASPRIRIFAEERNGSLELAIEDNGPGVPILDHEKVFDPFFTTKPPDAGLGLHTARGIIERLHGGLLRLDPDYDQGARFCISLPLRAQNSEREAQDERLA